MLPTMKAIEKFRMACAVRTGNSKRTLLFALRHYVVILSRSREYSEVGSQPDDKGRRYRRGVDKLTCSLFPLTTNHI